MNKTTKTTVKFEAVVIDGKTYVFIPADHWEVTPNFTHSPDGGHYVLKKSQKRCEPTSEYDQIFQKIQELRERTFELHYK